MRAAVIGSNWGAVHVAALRAAGVEVVALLGRDPAGISEAAQRLEVPRAATDIPHLAALARDPGLDLITVAAPPATHAPILAQLCAMAETADLPILCEKPAVGLNQTWQPPATRRAPIWVNYAFAFSAAAQQVTTALPSLGSIATAEVTCTFDLPGQLDVKLGLLEIASHPWSYLVTLLGAPTPARPTTPAGAGSQLTVELSCGSTPATVSVMREPGYAGIGHRVVLHTTSGQVEVLGRYRIGAQWEFAVQYPGADPVAVSPDQPGDPWYHANAAAIGAVVDCVRGLAADPRLFSWDAALAIDRSAQAAMA